MERGRSGGKLIELKVKPLPSEVTIQRILARNGLTHPLGAAIETAYYPWLPVWAINAVHVTDIITKHLHGGTEIQNFHTLDLFTQAAALTQHVDKTSATACAHLLKAWEKLGLPCLHQFDNEGAFCGGHTHRLIIGRMLRLCLLCGVEVIITADLRVAPADPRLPGRAIAGDRWTGSLHAQGRHIWSG